MLRFSQKSPVIRWYTVSSSHTEPRLGKRYAEHLHFLLKRKNTSGPWSQEYMASNCSCNWCLFYNLEKTLSYFPCIAGYCSWFQRKQKRDPFDKSEIFWCLEWRGQESLASTFILCVTDCRANNCLLARGNQPWVLEPEKEKLLLRSCRQNLVRDCLNFRGWDADQFNDIAQKFINPLQKRSCFEL